MAKSLSKKSYLIALSSYLETEKADIRNLSWEGANNFYVSVKQVYPGLSLTKAEYEDFQKNYVSRKKSWSRRKTQPPASHEVSKRLIKECGASSSC